MLSLASTVHSSRAPNASTARIRARCSLAGYRGRGRAAATVEGAVAAPRRRATGTPRPRRAAVVEEIKAAARAQLAERGAAALSVRHVARELGMSSSGMYRYFASRDELLTALIIDAYDHARRGRRAGRVDGRPRRPLRPVVGRGERGARLGEGPPPGVRARLRLTGPRLRRPAGHGRPRRPACPSPSRRSSATPGTPVGPRSPPSASTAGVDLAPLRGRSSR